MKWIRSSVVVMMSSLLLLSTTFAQIRFTSHTDKFEVLMPAAPTLKQETILISGQQGLLSYYGARSGQSDYAVLTLTGFNDPDWNVAHMLMLDLYCRINAPAGSFTAVFQSDISLNGYTGRLFSLERDERVGEWRIYDVNKTFYAVAGSSNARYDYSLRRFFDSFSLSGSNARTNAAVANRVSNPAARWLIILQTFSRNERARATRKMQLLRAQGYDTEVITTDSYSNLRPGLLAIAMGPFSKQAAQERLGDLRLVAPQSYIKAGW